MCINYLRGDATRPIVAPDQLALIVHIVNTRGGWGRGFVVAVSKRWPQPEAQYRKWHRNGVSDDGDRFELGQIQLVKVEPNLCVVNMLAQEGYGKNNQALHQSDEPNATRPIRLGALEQCLGEVKMLTNGGKLSSVHMARIGCGLAGATWDEVEPIVSRQLADVSVYVYDL